MKNALINQSKIFRSWTRESKEHLISKSQLLNFTPDQFVYMEGDISRHLYIVIEGSLSQVHIQENGNEILVQELEKGDVFGEIGFIDRLPREHSIISRTNSEILAIPKIAYIEVIKDMTFDVFWDFLSILAEKNRKLPSLKAADGKNDMESSVKDYLLSLRATNNFLIKISQQQIADALGTTRVNVSKALNNLEKKNIIKKQYSSIIINDNLA
ncbi:MAG: hypothetical protein DI586_09165 [Micavibrio aeruginosavorus]|uniref:Crp/Fnr family transcriptional regulator n=1 Tax=Micavibrio aeruginosavorus TaxID=349221 RepID=A0A2W5HLL1_9BACT|nr:MAG: hypothetical protein DI586_09165 [Micavibrio aeruginosavorus]